MALFEGKTSTERNKIIAAAILGVVALVALYFAFGRSLFSGTTTTATTKSSPTPRPTAAPGTTRTDAVLPTAGEQQFLYETTPVVYSPGQVVFAPDPGRNIFGFYEPPPPTPYIPPTPAPIVVKPPPPTPTPPIRIDGVNPQSAYAGAGGFRLELNGDKFTPESRIYFNQTEIPTVFVNAQRLIADIPANMIAQEGPRQVIVQTPDGKLYSNQFMFSIHAPPKPGLQYIGMIGRKRYNNDTAYFLDGSKPTPFGARLNDVLKDQQGQPRFRLVDISPIEVVLQDVNLGFRHRIPISKTAGTGSGTSTRPDSGPVPFDPSMQKDIPGIPNNIPRYIPPQPTDRKPAEKKQDVDDDGDGG